MRMGLLPLLCCFVASCGLARADEPAPPKPGPEHEMLKRFVGEWDAVVSIMGKEEKASAVYKMELGGFWLTEDFKGSFAGQKFEGRGATGYDLLKKKYVGTWVDSESPSLMVLEGAFDKDGKTFTLTGDGPPGMDGKPMKMKFTYDFPDKDAIVFTVSSLKDAKEQEFFKINYKRKK